MTARTLTELMAQNRDADRAIVHHTGENQSRRVGYGELYQRALGLLAHLQQLGARPGDHLILLLNNNEAFLDGFWAAVLGGVVPVPVAVGISDEHRRKLLRIAHKLGQPYILSDRKTLERIGQFVQQSGDTELAGIFAALRTRAFVVEDLNDISRHGVIHQARPEDTAFIQFSSGSTSDPKGVVLTHANLMAHSQATTQVAGFSERDTSLSWMPLTHDMGLIGFHLVMFAARVHTHLMLTELFVRRPLLWLSIASEIGATILCSPNFGYRHYLKVLAERSPGNLDLSGVRLIFNGAEPISVELCEEFLARMSSVGLKRTAMYPVYGLAEASLAATFPPVGRPYHTLLLDRHQLGVGARAQVVASGSRDAIALVSVGQPIPRCELRIAGEDDQPLPDGSIGHILIRGENVTGGYFREPELNAATFAGDWLRTGDLGLILDGETYITGRAKEILFVNGQNYYPHDLEAIAQRAPGMELGKVVVAGVRPPGAETDQLTVFALYRGDPAEFPPLAAEITRLINEQAGLEVAQVVPVSRIPKTTSGKIQRHLLEQQLLDGEFAADLAEVAKHSGGAGSRAAAASPTSIEARLLAICNGVLAGRPISAQDNLFEIGASSLKLIEIHEQIDRDYPGIVDLTELFDHPTVAALAKHLAAKLDQRA